MRPAVGRLPVRTVEVHGMQLRILQHFFDTPVAQPRRIPRRADLTGMKVWPTAHRMLRRMDETVLEQLRRAAAERARPLRVLELGSGTGIAGLGVALRLGRAASVVLTDPELAVNYAEAEAGTSLDLLRANVALNQPALEAAGAQVEARALEWADAAHARELRRACLPEGGEFDLVLGSELLYDSDHYAPLLAVLAAFVRSEATVAVLGYTHRSGSEARFLKQAAERFAVETEEFPRSEASAPWALSTLRYAPPPPPQTRESDRCGQQAGGARRRGYCSAAGPAPTAEQIDRMIAPPLHLTPHEQLELARSDDEQRGRRPLSLPAANSKGEVDYTSWGDYLLGRGWGEDNDLTDRLLVQASGRELPSHYPR